MSSTGVATAVALTLLAACGQAADDDHEALPPVVPMPAEQDLNFPLANAFAVAQAAFVNGDTRMYALTFADSAVLYVPGYGHMEGRNAIARDFAREGLRLAVRDVTRTSAGRYVDGREVVDSGTYVITAEAPLPEGGIPSTGRYWTRWRHLPDGTWVIVRDSLAGPDSTP